MSKAPLAALLLFALSGPVTAGKPPSTPPASSDPDIGFIYTGSNGTKEVRLAEEDGTGWATLASGSDIGFLALGPRSQHQLAYSKGNSIRLLTYSITSTGPKTVSDVQIAALDRSSPRMRFSPTGTHIAYVWPSRDDIYVYDLSTGQNHLVVDSHDTLIADVDFSPDGATLIYDQGSPSDLTHIQFKTIGVNGGSPSNLPINGDYDYFRLSHDGSSVVASMLTSWSGSVRIVPVSGGTPTTLTTGYNPSFNCSDGVVLFQRRDVAKHGQSPTSMLKYNLSTGLTSTFSTSDRAWGEYLC